MAAIRITESDYEKHRISNPSDGAPLAVRPSVMTLLCKGCSEMWQPVGNTPAKPWWLCPRECNIDTMEDETEVAPITAAAGESRANRRARLGV